MDKKTGRVWLVGAGCGDIGLLTVRGLSLLRQCDAVVYDDLIDPEILDAVPPRAERHYMGKRGGRPSAGQEDIIELLARLALSGKTVVRLKGGDPFVFGRGGEEMLALKERGIPCGEVPGVTSAIAIPAAAGIPVTHRRVSRSLHIITGHTAEGLPPELDDLGKLDGTLAFLMGLGHLEEIVERLLAAGKDPFTPAAVVSGGNSPHPVTVRGTLAEIAQAARAAQAQSPVVIVVGEVAAMDVNSPELQPLSGVRVGLTGTRRMTGRLRDLLETQGAKTVTLLSTKVVPLPMDFDWCRLADGKPHWLTFTSANGVEVFFDHLREAEMDLRTLHRCKFAVIGASTGRKLAEYGIRADLCPGDYTSAGLGAALCASVGSDEDVLVFRSAQGSELLGQLLDEGGIPWENIPLYDLRVDGDAARSARERLDGLDYLVFSSAGGVELFFSTVGELPAGTIPVCIGGVTARSLEKHTSQPFLLANGISAEGIVAAILEHRVDEN